MTTKYWADSVFSQHGPNPLTDRGDQVYLGPGDDYGEGGPGRDRLYGGPGSDEIDGEPGGDYLDGGPGDDYLYAGLGCIGILESSPGANEEMLTGTGMGRRRNLGAVAARANELFGGPGTTSWPGTGATTAWTEVSS